MKRRGEVLRREERKPGQLKQKQGMLAAKLVSVHEASATLRGELESYQRERHMRQQEQQVAMLAEEKKQTEKLEQQHKLVVEEVGSCPSAPVPCTSTVLHVCTSARLQAVAAIKAELAEEEEVIKRELDSIGQMRDEPEGAAAAVLTLSKQNEELRQRLFAKAEAVAEAAKKSEKLTSYQGAIKTVLQAKKVADRAKARLAGRRGAIGGGAEKKAMDEAKKAVEAKAKAEEEARAKAESKARAEARAVEAEAEARAKAQDEKAVRTNERREAKEKKRQERQERQAS